MTRFMTIIPFLILNYRNNCACIYDLIFSLYCSFENEHLQDQLRELKDENSRLFKLVSEKDFEIKHLKRRQEEERLVLAGTWRVSNTAEITTAFSRLMRSVVQAPQAWQGMWPPPKLWPCPRRTESCPVKLNERS